MAMDETRVRAGRETKGKMRMAYFWPLYGDQREGAFPYAPRVGWPYVGRLALLFGGGSAFGCLWRWAMRRRYHVHSA